MAIGGLKIYLYPANKLIQLSMNLLSPSLLVAYINSLLSKIEESPSSSISPGPLLSLRYCQLGNCFSEWNPQIKHPLIWELVGAINPLLPQPFTTRNTMGRPFGSFGQKSEPENHGLWQKQTHKTESKRKHLQFLLKSHHFLPVQKRIQRNLAPRVSHKAPVLGNPAPTAPVFSLTSVALVSPSAAVSVRSLSVCGSQRQSDPRRKQGQKTNPSGQTGHTLVEPFTFFPWGLWYPTFPREYGHEQSKEEAELGVFSRAPSEVKTRGTRTVGHPDLFAFTVWNINLSPHPFPMMPLEALPKKCLTQIEWRFIYTYFILVMPH